MVKATKQSLVFYKKTRCLFRWRIGTEKVLAEVKRKHSRTRISGVRQPFQGFLHNRNIAVTSLTSKPIPNRLKAKPVFQMQRKTRRHSKVFTSQLLTGKPLSRCGKLSAKLNAVHRNRRMPKRICFAICYAVLTVTASFGHTSIQLTRIFNISVVQTTRRTPEETVKHGIISVPMQSRRL